MSDLLIRLSAFFQHFKLLLFPMRRIRELEEKIHSLEKELVQAHKRAGQDLLTNLCNRYGMNRHFQNTLRVLFRDEDTVFVSVLCLDLDSFKVVNDTFGHAAGDEVLKTVSNILRLTFRRETDIVGRDIVARCGGDEFVMILCDVTGDQATKLAEKTIRLINEQKSLVFDQIRITASIGVAARVMKRHERPEEVLGELMKQGDAAMYTAKKKGKNQVIIHS